MVRSCRNIYLNCTAQAFLEGTASSLFSEPRRELMDGLGVRFQNSVHVLDVA